MLIQLAVLINLFMVPTLSIYLCYKGSHKSLTPSMDLLFQYCIAACANFVLTKSLLYFPKRLFGIVFSMDSAHYTIVALVAAWLLSQAFALSKKVKITVEVTSIAEVNTDVQTKTDK